MQTAAFLVPQENSPRWFLPFFWLFVANVVTHTLFQQFGLIFLMKSRIGLYSFPSLTPAPRITLSNSSRFGIPESILQSVQWESSSERILAHCSVAPDFVAYKTTNDIVPHPFRKICWIDEKVIWRLSRLSRYINSKYWSKLCQARCEVYGEVDLLRCCKDTG